MSATGRTATAAGCLPANVTRTPIVRGPWHRGCTVPAPRRAAARGRPRGAPAAASNGQSPTGPPLPARLQPAADRRRDTRRIPKRRRRRPGSADSGSGRAPAGSGPLSPRGAAQRGRASRPPPWPCPCRSTGARARRRRRTATAATLPDRHHRHPGAVCGAAVRALCAGCRRPGFGGPPPTGARAGGAVAGRASSRGASRAAYRAPLHPQPASAAPAPAHHQHGSLVDQPHCGLAAEAHVGSVARMPCLVSRIDAPHTMPGDRAGQPAGALFDGWSAVSTCRWRQSRAR